MWSDDEIKGKILHKLSRQGKFAHSHTAIEHLRHGFPRELRGRVKGCVQELAREGILRMKPTGYGSHVSVNVAKREEVLAYIRTFFEK